MKRTLGTLLGLPVPVTLLVRATPSKHGATVPMPGPTGHSRVGTHVMNLVDPTRDDPFPGRTPKSSPYGACSEELHFASESP